MSRTFPPFGMNQPLNQPSQPALPARTAANLENHRKAKRQASRAAHPEGPDYKQLEYIVDYIPWIKSLDTAILPGVENETFKKLCQDLAKQIKVARQKADLSQEALALMAAVDRTYVSQLERGVANPSLQILHRLAQTLGLELRITFAPPAKKAPSDDD